MAKRNFFPKAHGKALHKEPDTLSPAIDSTVRNGDSVSRRRFQRGSVYQNQPKTMWIGEYSEYVLDTHGVERRKRKQVVLCPVKCDGVTIGKRAAERLLQPLIDKVNTAISSPGRERKSTTFEAFAEIWKRDYLSQSKPSTQSACKSYLKNLVTIFGNRDMRSIDAGDIQRMIALRMSQKESPWTPKTVRNVWGIINQIWQAALAQKYVDALLPKPKLPRRPKTKARFFRLIDAANIIAASEGEQRALYWLVAETGLRSGELAGLKLSDIDLDGGSLTVNTSVWNGQDQTPKTENANRTLALSPQCVALLREQIERQKAKAHEYVFTSANGTPLDMNVYRRRKLHTLLASLKIPKAGFHAFRHFNVSLLDALRVPLKTIQERLGHALTGSFTLDVYGGKPEWDRNLEAAQLLGAEIEKAVQQVERQQEAENFGEKPIILAA